MNTRTATKTSAQTATPKAKVKATVITPPTAMERAISRFQEAQEELMANLGTPSWKRTICALLTALGVGMGIGWVASFVINAVTMAVFAATGMAFIAWAVWIIGVIAAMWFGGKFAARCGMSVYTGDADESIRTRFAEWRMRTAMFVAPKDFAS